MTTRHCSDDELIARLYGLGEVGEGVVHLSACPECRQRLEAMSVRRSEMLTTGHVSDDFLREQRVRIHARIEQDRRYAFWLRPAPAVAAALVLAAGLMFRTATPTPSVVPAVSAESDTQFFSEIATVVDQHEPRAADPIRGLFDEADSK